MRDTALVVALGLWINGSQDILAGDVQWLSQVVAADNRDSINSALNSEWEFHLGYFESGFAPTSSNTSQWAANWTSLDSARYFEQNSRFSSLYENDGSATGRAGYIWGLNRSSAANEWILMRDSSWSFPFSGGIAPTENWSVNSVNQVVVGAVNVGGVHMQTASVSGEPPFLDYAAWQQIHFSDSANQANQIGGETDDPDGDGVVNLVEYALGTGPRSGVSHPCLEQTFQADGRQRIAVALARQVSATVTPQVSGNLTSWSGSQLTILTSTSSILLFRDNSFAGTRFARVEVALP